MMKPVKPRLRGVPEDMQEVRRPKAQIPEPSWIASAWRRLTLCLLYKLRAWLKTKPVRKRGP